MEKKKGFTLIELLAIIVILAIIAVITVPLILGIIDESKQKASVASAYGFKEGVEKDYAKKLLNSNEQNLNGTYTITNGKINNQDVSISGTKPSNGTLTYQNNKLVSGCLTIDGYKVQYQNDEFTATKGECDVELVCSDTEYIYEENTYEKNLNATSNACETYFKRQNYLAKFVNNELDIQKYCRGQKIPRKMYEEDYSELVDNNIIVETDNGYAINKEECILSSQTMCEPGDTECIEETQYYCNNDIENDVLHDIYDDIYDERWEIESLKLHGIINNDNSLNTMATSNTCKTVKGISCQNAECLDNNLEYCNSNQFSDEIDYLINQNMEEEIDFYVSVGIINEKTSKSCITISPATNQSCFTYAIENNKVTITGYTCEDTIKNVVLPNGIIQNQKGIPVIAIGDSAFDDIGITSIEIPDSVLYAGDFAVSNVDSIKIGNRTITYNTVMNEGRKAPGQLSDSFKMLEINDNIRIYTENGNKVSINLIY